MSLTALRERILRQAIGARNKYQAWGSGDRGFYRSKRARRPTFTFSSTLGRECAELFGEGLFR
ncbi:hypothetical protein ACWIG5_38170, partial [Streptomyces lydicus]